MELELKFMVSFYPAIGSSVHGSLCKWAAVRPLTWPRFHLPLKAQLSHLVMTGGLSRTVTCSGGYAGQLLGAFLTGTHTSSPFRCWSRKVPCHLSLREPDSPFGFTRGSISRWLLDLLKRRRIKVISNFTSPRVCFGISTTSCYSVLI